MPTVYLGLGSNMGDRRAHLAWALRRLDQEYGLTGVSSVWETEPVGYRDQGRFLNLVARVETEVAPRPLLDRLRTLEAERGRERTFRDAPRTLDIDVLLYGREVVEEEGLKVPHPRMAERGFVLVPLLELDAEVEDPRTGLPFAERPVAQSSGTGVGQGMERVMAGEELLRAYDDG